MRRKIKIWYWNIGGNFPVIFQTNFQKYKIGLILQLARTMSIQNNETSVIQDEETWFEGEITLIETLTHPTSGELDIEKCRNILGSEYSKLSDKEIAEVYNITLAYANFIINIYHKSLWQKM